MSAHQKKRLFKLGMLTKISINTRYVLNQFLVQESLQNLERRRKSYEQRQSTYHLGPAD